MPPRFCPLGLLLACILSFGLQAAEPSLWKAGSASVVITPETNMWMAGYAARKKPSEGKAQDLFAKALALEDEAGHRLVIVTMDLIGVPRTLRQSLAARAQTAYKLEPESLLLNASHTHCGPEFRVGRTPADDGEFGPAKQGEQYGRQLEEKVFKLVGESLKKLEPAKVSYCHARCGFAMNRRLPSPTGYRNSPYADGPVDQDVPVLRVDSPDGKQLRAVLFGYSCHNTTLSFYQFCGDYAGYAQEYLQAARPGMVALYMQGCGGDQNPYPRGTLELAQEHGRELALAVETALIANQTPLTGSLRSAFTEIALDYAQPPSQEEFTQRLKSKDSYEKSHAERMLEIIKQEGRLPASYPYPIQVVHLGKELTLVALGGEVVVDYALRFKRELAGPAVWVAGYSNDVMAYIPSLRILNEGGYEAGDAMKYGRTHPGPWAATAEERIVSQVRELDRRLTPLSRGN